MYFIHAWIIGCKKRRRTIIIFFCASLEKDGGTNGSPLIEVGFEPTKHYAVDLKSTPFDRSGTQPNQGT